MEKGKKKKNKNVKLRTFEPKDMIAPTFEIGIVFPTTVDLKAIQEYSIQNSGAIKYAKNDKQRIKAHYEENCLWYLFAAPDSRNQSYVVKTYVGTHTCSKEWKLKAFSAKYLVARYIQNFRADDKMTLIRFSRLVRQDYNMTMTRSKLQRARRITMKLVNGDEEKQYIMLWDYAEEIRRSNPGSNIHGTSIGYTCH